MEEAGYATGTKLDVRVMPGCLVITARPTITPLMQVLNKTNELPETTARYGISSGRDSSGGTGKILISSKSSRPNRAGL